MSDALGPLLAERRVPTGRVMLGFAFVTLLCALACAVSLAGLVLTFAPSLRPDPQPLPWLGCLYFGGLAAFAFGWKAGELWHRRLAGVRLLRDGIVAFGRGPDRLMRWDEIDWLYFNPGRRRDGDRLILSAADRTIAVHEFVGSEALQDVLREAEERTLARLLATVEPAFASGESVAFDSLLVSRSGVSTVLGKPVPWDGIGTVTLNNGILAIVQNGHFLPLFIGSLKNHHVVMALIRRARKEAPHTNTLRSDP